MASALVLVLGGVAVSYIARTPEAPAGPPNVVVIAIDTLRPEYTGVYGHVPDTTPFLTRLAAHSAVFERAYSTSSWTAPSMASLFTSMYPHQHGVTQGFYAHQDILFQAMDAGDAAIPLNAMPAQLTTLPEMFKEAGYATFGISANRNVGHEMGFAEGFDRFMVENDRRAEGMYGTLRSWLREIRRSEPYFVYFHLMDPHFPYLENAPYFSVYKRGTDDYRAQYLSEIAYMDRWIERVFKLLRADRDTLLVFVTDHGEEFRDHGHVQHGPFLYNELQRAMIMVYGPQYGVVAKQLDENVSLIDVLPTLAEFIGVPEPPEAKGTSLLATVTERPDRVARAFWDERVLLGHRALPVPPYQEHWSATRGTWKYIEHVGLAAELFDHGADPHEQENVAGAHSGVAADLAAAVAEARGAPRAFTGEALQVPVDEELFEELRSLGYTN